MDELIQRHVKEANLWTAMADSEDRDAALLEDQAKAARERAGRYRSFADLETDRARRVEEATS